MSTLKLPRTLTAITAVSTESSPSVPYQMPRRVSGKVWQGKSRGDLWKPDTYDRRPFWVTVIVTDDEDGSDEGFHAGTLILALPIDVYPDDFVDELIDAIRLGFEHGELALPKDSTVPPAIDPRGEVPPPPVPNPPVKQDWDPETTIVVADKRPILKLSKRKGKGSVDSLAQTSSRSKGKNPIRSSVGDRFATGKNEELARSSNKHAYDGDSKTDARESIGPTTDVRTEQCKMIWGTKQAIASSSKPQEATFASSSKSKTFGSFIPESEDLLLDTVWTVWGAAAAKQDNGLFMWDLTSPHNGVIPSAIATLGLGPRTKLTARNLNQVLDMVVVRQGIDILEARVSIGQGPKQI